MAGTSRIIAFPDPPRPVGGPGTFQLLLEDALARLGWTVVYPHDHRQPHVVLVIAATAELKWLMKVRRRGARIVQRLGGILYRHRLEWPGWRLYAWAEARNMTVRCIRRFMADHVVYQSHFVRNWWRQSRGAVRAPETIIYNGTDLERFRPSSTRSDALRIVCVEGRFFDDPGVSDLLSYVAAQRPHGEPVRISLFGRAPDALKARLGTVQNIEFNGPKPRHEMPSHLANHDIFLSLETNAACPNAVIEALASGLPVLGYKTGALPELVPPEAGILLDYDANPWALESPSIDARVLRALEDLDRGLDAYKAAARRTAVERLDATRMARAYVTVFERALGGGQVSTELGDGDRP